MGRDLSGIYHLGEDRIYVYDSVRGGRVGTNRAIEGLAGEAASALLGEHAAAFREEIELIRGAMPAFDADAYLAGRQTPVHFGSAISNFGVEELLRSFVRHSPPPRARRTTTRDVEPMEPALTGFVFKIQANMRCCSSSAPSCLRARVTGCASPDPSLAACRRAALV